MILSTKYDDNFKREILVLRASGKQVSELNKTYNLGKNTISQWAKRFSSDETVSEPPKLTKEQLELRALRKEVKELRDEVSILKPAISSLLKKKT